MQKTHSNLFLYIFLCECYIQKTMSSFASLETYFFGPLDKKYCTLFYVFTFIYLVLFLIALFIALKGILTMIGKKGKLPGFNDLLSTLYGLAFSFLLYIQSRLLYSMCTNSNLEESA